LKYLDNTLTKEFGLHPETHDEFTKTFRENWPVFWDYLRLAVTAGRANHA
jgi:hypothetical protein